jgi:dTDP-4-dehydrorhamnose reductase
MLGNVMMRLLSNEVDLDVFGTARSSAVCRHFESSVADRILLGIDVENADALALAMAKTKPQVVINCIGLIKQLAESNDPLRALPINAILPHRLARLCKLAGARLVHISTDCVFSGKRGNYLESDPSDAEDLYGKSKCLGEVVYEHSITLRTSIIGHELESAQGLVSWFLAQKGSVSGYRRAIFSGLPTVELADVVRNVVLKHADLSGLYHVASKPISKLELLRLIAATYKLNVDIEPDDRVLVDRSLNADRFRHAAGYVAPPWPELVARMKNFG